MLAIGRSRGADGGQPFARPFPEEKPNEWAADYNRIPSRAMICLQLRTEGVGFMAMSGSSFRMMVAIAACAFGTVIVDAAEIRVDMTVSSGAILEGKIKAGDFDKLRSFIFDGDGAENIFLVSPGGDLAEAMKIGRLVRQLKLTTSIPDKLRPASRFDSKYQKEWIARYNLKDLKANYMCASACFFVFVAGIHREVAGWLSDLEPVLGIHRPYLSENDLRALSSDKAIAVGTRTRVVVEDYLKEMGVPAKYADQMFSAPKNEVRWIKNDEFEADFNGFIPGLKDWVDARCDKRTEIEKRIWEEVKDKTNAQLSTAERVMTEVILKKNEGQDKCERDIQSELAIQAYRDALEKRNDRKRPNQ